MKHAGRGVIRLGDATDHGGKVTSASSGSTVMGKTAALADDTTFCPKCKGSFPINRTAPAQNTWASRTPMTAMPLPAAPT